jgi:hypothetical protein
MSTFEPDWTRMARDRRRRSPPLSPSSGLSTSSPLKRKRPSSARAWLGGSPVRLVAAYRYARAAPSAPPRAVRGIDGVVARSAAAVGSLANQRLDGVVLPVPLGPTSEMLAALEKRARRRRQHAQADRRHLQARVVTRRSRAERSWL